ncbi:hypothetical protein [Paraconexibacter algicola]|uniref:Uncharacterized protein n=1 Tax=Paraconexibacter algicola TaxID=2133960 RepID=A0A2T4UE38_9ACTN|nr:hypothetical protein [Paraconexibacter algicola]PTL55776.1 hypothetical protein C7Y72_19295 [Paraconexibacter algicola]
MTVLAERTWFLTVPDVLPRSFNRVGASGSWRVWQTHKKLWERRLVALLGEEGVPVASGAFARTTAILTVPDRRRRDAGNFGVVLEKSLGDALQLAGVIPDDTPEWWSWTSVSFSYERGASATTFVVTLLPDVALRLDPRAPQMDHEERTDG